MINRQYPSSITGHPPPATHHPSLAVPQRLLRELPWAVDVVGPHHHDGQLSTEGFHLSAAGKPLSAPRQGVGGHQDRDKPGETGGFWWILEDSDWLVGGL